MLLPRVGLVCLVVLLWMMAGTGAVAEGRRGSLPNGGHQAWTAADEVTLGGQVTEVPMKRVAGAPLGLNFAMSGSQHSLMVNAGANLSEMIRSRIRVGETVRVTGVVRSVNGQEYLLVRTLVVGGTTVHVRSRNGFPVREMGSDRPRPRTVKSDLKGGAR
ncbi:hypothetical protein [Edaphobacter sp. 12200R-103]|uniref:hypothetical protein n=1 Tax=Edaphobacter sp. 12200R-103 TaxID=2703788 RepID=UPI00138B472E|nr:hypothetical protein [Edaphobacter sp. 12200R-103]QHS50551.1 hypothetical protein GWR55_01395 [Edaphobacter sp. 12200R-103]